MAIELDLILRWLHVVGACILLGTGAGIAFFMVMACRTRNAALIAHTAAVVVVADLLFTTTAVIVQPITGTWLALRQGWELNEGWILLSLLLYGVTGVFWLPVVWIQLRLRDLARTAAGANVPLGQDFDWLYRIWFACGFPAFAAVLTILWLMLSRPDISLWWP